MGRWKLTGVSVEISSGGGMEISMVVWKLIEDEWIFPIVWMEISHGVVEIDRGVSGNFQWSGWKLTDG